MKIYSVGDPLNQMTRVQEKQDTDAHSRNRKQEDQGRKNKENNLPIEEVTDENIDLAIKSFTEDAQNRANGLHADKLGSGPGLKIVLKDGTGTVIRQLTGEEFLKVREAADKDGRVHGKILDQKL
ncbi:MAG: hypothetical protein A2583_12250 [Bdellovibrionales bacterium RIFOXYD1_FULL_53_11]|nr:MAG: hypothetical protein A2583_12250 [Bdellovibrionales bacterium RIFOXYD1_FULL_53_11]